MRKNGQDQLLQTIQLPKDLTRLTGKLPKSKYDEDTEMNESTAGKKLKRNPQEPGGQSQNFSMDDQSLQEKISHKKSRSIAQVNLTEDVSKVSLKEDKKKHINDRQNSQMSINQESSQKGAKRKQLMLSIDQKSEIKEPKSSNLIKNR